MPAVSASPAPDKAAASAAEARGRTPRDVLEEGITEITRLSAQLPVNRRAVFGTAARVVREALALDECWVFWRDDPAAALAARLGDGPRFAAIRDVATVEATRKNVFTVCAESGEIVLIPRPDDPKLRPFIPRWLQPLTETASFVLLPVRNPDGAIAILCGVGKNGQYPGLTAPIRQQISVLSRLLARCCQPSWNAPPLR
jgi:hypothetical protein